MHVRFVNPLMLHLMLKKAGRRGNEAMYVDLQLIHCCKILQRNNFGIGKFPDQPFCVCLGTRKLQKMALCWCHFPVVCTCESPLWLPHFPGDYLLRHLYGFPISLHQHFNPLEVSHIWAQCTCCVYLYISAHVTGNIFVP